jgi:SNF2 family DNA or RNA helicase
MEQPHPSNGIGTAISADLVLHGTWSRGAFVLWAETALPGRRQHGRRRRVPYHPHAAWPERLIQVLEELVPLGDWSAAQPTVRTVLLPTEENGPVLAPWLRGESVLEDARAAGDSAEEAGELRLRPWRVPCLALDALPALDLLSPLPLGETLPRWCGADLRYWSLAAKQALAFLAQHKYVPALEEEEGRFRAYWRLTLDSPEDRSRLHKMAQGMPPACRALLDVDLPPDAAWAAHPHEILDDYLRATIDASVRVWGRPRLDRRRKTPDGVAGAWWAALWEEPIQGERPGQIDVPIDQRRALVGFYEHWQEWFAQLRGEEKAAFRVCFRLEPPQVDNETGRVTEPDWCLRYLLQANDDPSLLVPAAQVWGASEGTLKVLNHRFQGAQEHMLTGLGRAASIVAPVKESLRAMRPESCVLSVEEAYDFMQEKGLLLEQSGFGVLVPPWWNKPDARLRVRARAGGDPAQVGRGILNKQALVHFDWELALGDEALTREELERLAALKMPLVQVRGQWVRLRPDEIEAAIAFWEKRRLQEELGLQDALGVALGATDEVAGLPLEEVETEGWIDDLLRQLGAGDQLAELPAPPGFAGQLRPYQERGYSWLAFLRQWGLGACLADDMGLGKTIQAIALLLHVRHADGEAARPLSPALVICPTSVVGNWKREVNRFAPEFQVLVHHGSDRARGDEFVEVVEQHDVVISTYGLARRDVDDLRRVSWGDVILDEAQNIKNPQAKQTQAIRKLEAVNRMALTGTPVENRLSELWSIMHFLNPGYLGSRAAFHKRFALPIERYADRDVTDRLKTLVSPFVLRRLKTDASIIQDLPEKLEMKVYCNLTPEQATLYQAVVQEAMERVEKAEQDDPGGRGMQRRGVVLSMLLRLKQVCNHPAQFLGDGSQVGGRSGKLNRLAEMLEEALSVDDRALIFTQFSTMGHMLQGYLRSLFGVEVLYLHGGTPQKQRDRMVGRFQRGRDGKGPPLFILSLKAGGTGLNLTAANHVFHYDRWWNPAVENQATDRAFRIGQTRDVQVHKYLCAGTLEERIDELIESKLALAQSVVGTGEDWLTELGTDELRDLMTLRTE